MNKEFLKQVKSKNNQNRIDIDRNKNFFYKSRLTFVEKKLIKQYINR